MEGKIEDILEVLNSEIQENLMNYLCDHTQPSQIRLMS